MPTDTPIAPEPTDPSLSEIEEGDTVKLHIQHNTRSDRAITATAERVTTFGGGTELRLSVNDTAVVRVYGDYHPPIVEQGGHTSGRLERIERAE